MNEFEFSDFTLAILCILIFIGAIIVLFLTVYAIVWPLDKLFQINKGQDGLLDDMEKLKKKLGIKEDTNEDVSKEE